MLAQQLPSLLFLVSLVAFAVVVIWTVRHDGARNEGASSGILAMTDEKNRRSKRKDSQQSKWRRDD